MAERFTGAVEALAPVDVAAVAAWISAIDLRDWPQQDPPGHPLKPAMVTDLAWHGFGAMVAPVVYELLTYLSNGSASNRMLSVVMPGDGIPPHRDQQGPEWLCRVHVPLVSNDRSRFIVRGKPYEMAVGTAYLVNTLAEHAVENAGTTPRIHLMFDVVSSGR